MRIVDFDQRIHRTGVQSCVIELQDFERAIDPRMPRGADIVDEYLPQLLFRCKACAGQMLVAEVDREVAGYVVILTKVESEDIECGELVYGLVADLVVRDRFRGCGVGKSLLDAAEKYARSHDVSSLRVGVLTGNQAARKLYASRGYASIFIELEKDLRSSG